MPSSASTQNRRDRDPILLFTTPALPEIYPLSLHDALPICEILQLKETINTMVDQLNAFAGEVTRVAREVGTEGRLAGQANVPGVAGTWKDLTEIGRAHV